MEQADSGIITLIIYAVIMTVILYLTRNQF